MTQQKAEFLWEILSEEIPARMQVKAADDLRLALEKKLRGAELPFNNVETFVTPRRLTAVVHGISLATQARKEERRGPKTTAPEAAVQGFLKSAGVSLADCLERDGYWVATIATAAQQTAEILPELLRSIIREFSWPKSMRWAGATQQWIRPLRGILAILDHKVLTFDLPEFGLTSTDRTVGHRFLSTGDFTVTAFQNYREKCLKAFVILDHAERQNLIQEQLTKLGAEKGYVLEADERLLEEVAGLAEFPQPLLGTIHPQFMRLPKAVLSTSMRVHQKYFTFVDKNGKVAPIFGLVANTIPSDDGAEMLRGYQRVLSARLSDAAFFYDQDLKTPLSDNVNKLYPIVYHAKLGSLGQRVERLQSLVQSLDVKRAALLCKADLVSGMVGEFPELQGIMGAIYAQEQGETPAVAAAIQEHYQPQGPMDHCPTAAVSVELALADKLDTLVGFFAIGEAPTGSKDPYALRRAALGLIRLLREGSGNNKQAYPLRQKISEALGLYREQNAQVSKDFTPEIIVQFIFDRLAHALRAEGMRHDAITAVMSSPNCGDDIWSIGERARVLSDYLNTESGLALQAAFRRANGILAQEGQAASTNQIRVDLLTETSEKNLYALLSKVAGQCQPLLDQHDYKGLMNILADLRTPVDQFFELKINHDDQLIRMNRWGMLQMLVQQTTHIADFTKLEG